MAGRQRFAAGAYPRDVWTSLNPLNVAITRARVKTVVFLSRSLLEPPLQALDQEEVANGIAFVQGKAADPSTMVISV